MSDGIREPFHKNPPSELFETLLTDTSSIWAECEFCGRTFFEDDPGAGDWEAGELEGLQERAARSPHLVIAMDHVAQGRLNGKTGVFGCPCNWATQYEEFIWGHRRFIMDYISAKVKGIVERALEDEGKAEQASGDVVQVELAEQTVRCPVCLKFVSQLAMPTPDICIHCVRRQEEAKEAAKIAADLERQKLRDAENAKREAQRMKAQWDKEQQRNEEFEAEVRNNMARGMTEEDARREAEGFDNLPF